ncbi:FecR domain-containing protein [Chitinophaga sp. 212800010-3]|uniref:FecR family protein n=1 Tax=unclassified Chitinophaga TaxID=2619133 RepID=UPI002DE80BCB|nr:FecR family protein [Chitinophaga sp. 212800010-3]
MKEQRLEELFGRFMHGRLSDMEETELLQLWLDSGLDAQRAKILDAFYDRLPEDKDMTYEEAESIFQKIVHARPPMYRLPKRRAVRWSRWVAAASVVLIVGAVGTLLLFQKKDKPRQFVHRPVVQDVNPPQSNKAMIMLSDGKRLDLDSTVNGPLAVQGNIKLIKLDDGQIVYEKTADDVTTPLPVTYNTLTNPRGSKTIDIALSDGSHVWLNAGSSLTFPVAFAGNERHVSMTGEAYFEVGQDADQPFIITKGETTVKVLGTHFNVNAYDNEEAISVTLLEGRVSVNKANKGVIIQPGQQAIVTNTISIENQVNVNQVMAWKNGLFEFRETDIQTVMRQIERWYDVEVVFDGVITQHFNGSIQRDANISKVLQMLEETGGLRFSIEGKKVVIKKFQRAAG